jgi:hypothetical protein
MGVIGHGHDANCAPRDGDRSRCHARRNRRLHPGGGTRGRAAAGLDGELPVPDDAAAQVRESTERRELHDEDGDGFVSRAEAEGYYRGHLSELDDDNDGRLSRAKLEPGAPGAPDLELAYEELVGATEQEYVDDNLRKYDLRADRTVGMMSTREFDELVGDADPAISIPRPGIYP